MQFTYPAVFHAETEGGYSISFPDIAGCYSQCETITNGKIMAADALTLMLHNMQDNKAIFPTPTPLSEIQKRYPEDIILLITADI